MKRALSIILIGLFLFVTIRVLPARSDYKGLKKRVAVFSFVDKTNRAYAWWGGKTVGRGLSDMLVTALVKSGKYTVVERGSLDKVLTEQKLGLSGLVTPQTAAQVGKLLGVELAIVGSVTEFGHKKSNVGGRLKGIGLGIGSQSAVVAVDVRFINTTTGEIIRAETVRKEKSKKGLSISTPKFSFHDRNSFDQSLVGKAAREAVNEIVEMTGKTLEKMPWEAKIIKASAAGNIYINKGSRSGVAVGDVFVVYRKGEALIDPDTGLSLGAEEEKIGTIKVVKDIAGGRASVATVLTGSGFQTGDIVKLK
ncbi:putative lipoprotein/NMB1164 precursor [bacterium BMS3Abin05]|nr:putative lipoprotein/NMB1164 precursor [bacterium BMS3Abin05]GBE27884.1 putative lipoprotein/NMB1164 precursor [bacterium BMS3Bbin03]HDK35722.1 hypothetical protein [Bacteroidota bacterium]HDZ12503.1 hypothetical protein [Bacteroidota bacterium]